MLQTFRNSPRFQAVVLGVLGILLLITALSVHVPLWLGVRYQRRLQSWGMTIPIDFSAINKYQESFQPIKSLIGNPKLRMRGPLLSEFKETHLSGANVPANILQESFSKSAIDFGVSWKILDEDKVFDSGVFGPNDVVAWSYPYYVSYKAEDYSGYRHLDIEKTYLLIVEVTKPCEVLNKFKPTFILGPSPTKKVLPLFRRLMKLTIPLSIMGIVLLAFAVSTYRSVNRARTAQQ
jgi:hypothetical protein